MGFIQPNLPVVDIAEWSKGTRAERIVPMMPGHIAENGFGTPLIMHCVCTASRSRSTFSAPGCSRGPPTGIDGFTNVADVVDRADRVPEGRALTRCCSKSSASVAVSGRWPVATSRRWVRSCTGCGPAPSGCHPGPDRVPLTNGQQQNAVRRAALRCATARCCSSIALVSDGSRPNPVLCTA